MAMAAATPTLASLALGNLDYICHGWGWQPLQQGRGLVQRHSGAGFFHLCAVRKSGKDKGDEAILSDNLVKQGWVKAKLNSLQDSNAAPGGSVRARESNCASVCSIAGEALCMHEPSLESLWQNYFKNPSQWWDGRSKKFHSEPPKSNSLCVDNLRTPKGMKNIGAKTAFSLRKKGASLIDQSYLQPLCEAGRLNEVMDVLEKEGMSASRKMYARLLCKCGQLTALSEAKRLHSHLVKRSLELDSFIGSGIVEMYVKCGSLVDALQVHKRLPQRSEFAWTALISGYVDSDQCRQALKWYKEMREEGVKASRHTFIPALKACCSLGDLETGKQIHGHMIEGGNEIDVFAATTLMDMYAKCGSMVDAQHVFEGLAHPDVVSWTAMILGYSLKEEGGLALALYAEMLQAGFTPDNRTFVGALKACASLAVLEVGTEVDENVVVRVQCLQKGRAIHSRVVLGGFETNLFVGTTLVDMYAKCASMVDARDVFDKLPHRNVVSWNVMILGYAQKEEGEVALQLYAQLQQEGIAPDDRTFVGTLKACSSLATLEQEAEADGKYVKVGCLEKGRAIHSQIVRSGFQQNVFVGTSLVELYAKCGSMEEARQAFDKLPSRDVVAWTTLILGYAERGESEEAFKLFLKMQEQGLSADCWTFTSILKACGNTAALETGRNIHAHICRVGVEKTLIAATALIDMYSKCGSMVDAQRVFDELAIRDSVAWNALILGYARQGQSDIVFQLYEIMRQEGGTHPNGATFLSVLTVCSHVGLVGKGQEYFEAMTKDYEITPTVEHLTCMVDLLGRAGQVSQAVAMVKSMLPSQADQAMWLSVLGACRKFKNVEAGRYAFECAVKLDETNAAPYVLMSNIYADAQMWEEHDTIRARERRALARKRPGQSWWTDACGITHTFGVADTEHPERKGIYAKLKLLSLEGVYLNENRRAQKATTT